MQQRRKLQTHFSLKPKLITKQQTFVGCYTYLLLMLLFYKFKGWKISNSFTNSHISEMEVLVLGSLFNNVESLRIRVWQRYFLWVLLNLLKPFFHGINPGSYVWGLLQDIHFSKSILGNLCHPEKVCDICDTLSFWLTILPQFLNPLLNELKYLISVQ